MKATDVERAQQELIRLRELERALKEIEEDGFFAVKGGARDFGCAKASHLHISGGRSATAYGALSTETGYASIRDVVTAAYREEISQAKAKLRRLGVDAEDAGEPQDGEAKAA